MTTRFVLYAGTPGGLARLFTRVVPAVILPCRGTPVRLFADVFAPVAGASVTFAADATVSVFIGPVSLPDDEACAGFRENALAEGWRLEA